MTGVRSLRREAGAGDAWLDEAVRALREGHLLAHPTESVYGLGAVPRELDGEIARLKGREADRPLLRLAGSVEVLREAHPGLRWSAAAEQLGTALWPGPLTLVLDDGSPSGLGVRVEGHPDTRRLLLALDGTMSSTSLNRSGRPPARTEEEALRVLDEMPDARVPVWWLEAGTLAGPPPSTVLSLMGEAPTVLREGALPVGRIAEVLGREPVRA